MQQVKFGFPANTDLAHIQTILSATGAIDISGATFQVFIGDVPKSPSSYSVKVASGRLIVTGSHGHRVIFR